MAYCVHCGVKLGDSEKRCPLCNTLVLDPWAPHDPSIPRAYPVRTPEQELKRSKHFFLWLAALMLLCPALLCLMIDLMQGGLTWSLYPSSALSLLFLAVIVPILVPKYRLYVALAACFTSLSVYLYLVQIFSKTSDWFFPIVLPSLALTMGFIILVIFLYRHGRLNKLTLLAALFGAVSLDCLAIECFCSLGTQGTIAFHWSPYAAAPCFFISLALFFINGNRSVREEVRRRVHF